jgi:hypothetical protein
LHANYFANKVQPSPMWRVGFTQPQMRSYLIGADHEAQSSMLYQGDFCRRTGPISTYLRYMYVVSVLPKAHRYVPTKVCPGYYPGVES